MEGKIKFFKSQAEWRKWLEKNHTSSAGSVVGFYKKSSGKGGITYPESLDEALCFGWIDGLRKGIDENSYTIRFSPRKRQSIWSNVNIKHIERLTEDGKMKPQGIAAFNARTENKSGIYSFEQKNVKLDSGYEKKLKSNKKAWTFFSSQATWYRRTSVHWVMSAKREATRLKRLSELINDSAYGLKIKPLRYPSK